ncbi:hypothetical protein [Acrocarpospora sp. B8E8]|uniref:hypothetical protein n=1 Tax=Acrocarpospora sp. B8E8 TaxID=3153572 RepID=UPI00325F0781
MAAKKAHLVITPGSRSDVVIDGQRLTGVRGINLTASVHEKPQLSLDLVIREVEIDGEFHIEVPDKTRAALITLGWTPPDQAIGYEIIRTTREGDQPEHTVHGPDPVATDPDEARARFADGAHAREWERLVLCKLVAINPDDLAPAESYVPEPRE